MSAPEEMHKLMPGHLIAGAHCARLRVYVAGTKKAAVERDSPRSRRSRCARGAATMGRSHLLLSASAPRSARHP
eukprot:2618694-Pyramimonas_sp.AAC.1